MSDELKQSIRAMDIPAPTSGAVQRVVSQARQMQQQGGIWLRLLQWRSLLDRRQMRYAIMAICVVGFATIGWLKDTPQPTQTTVAQETLLEDVTFAEEQWAKGVDWSG